MLICPQCYQTNTACQACNGAGVTPDAQAHQVPKKDIRLFGTKDYPIHASAVPEIIRCQWKAAMIYLATPDDESGEAADTGSMTHVAVAAWHRDKDIAAAISALRESEARFAKGNVSEATSMFYLYTRDPRNHCEIATDQEGRLLVEYKTQISITPSKSDPTQAPIEIVGTLDQVRLIYQKPKVWDLKTSKRPGLDQLNMYLYQIGMYSLMASKALGMPVSPGGLITPRHYKKGADPETSPPGIFWEYPLRFNDIGPLINGLRNAVASIRAGTVHPSPGDYCRYCPMQSTGECIPLLRSLTDAEYRVRSING